ncbi:excisionase [Candidatus Shapirobacteria bacterium CG11_big_fil_rev_8_21_14_0_20_40_12]|uniref:Excisionase n=1 Tax=Candidatus Shapirobacteria bacterium CG11_big_fil_rev_8_21_14_0_20_40_12 TaxID=1974889 RepID=A0A2H0KID2_9BACT|nr:MAG: excisionase [Candidatus Shapirobacteria bacterium CG11_big_fil_rev_8_21_14_0_20_40_12]
MGKINNFLTISEIAKKLKVSERTIYRFVESGKLKAHKLTRGTTRIAEKDLNQFLKKHKTK